MTDEATTLRLVLPVHRENEPVLAEARPWSQALLDTPGEDDHIVQFYEDEAFLFDAVAHFTGAGLAAGEPVLIVASEEHRAGFARELQRNGCDVESAIASGQLTLLDARSTLQTFMVGDEPDWDRFRGAVGPVLDKCRAGRTSSRVRVFGEMVDLLWRGGNRPAAIRLEQLWNQLARRQSFTLLCAYAMGNFFMPGDGELFDKVCARHTHVVPGAAASLWSLHNEVEQRKQLEAALRATLRKRMVDAGAMEERSAQDSQRFRLLVESVEDYAIFMLDAQGRVTSWNIGAERIKGYRAEEIVGQHFSRFYPEEDVRAGKCEMELAAAAREGRFEDEGWRVRKDGSTFWANVVISRMLDPEGKLLGFAKVTRDLTNRRALEDERVQRASLERALGEQKQIEELREQLIGVVGHDLRTPLSSIVMGASLMLKRGMMVEADVKVAARIARSGDRMTRIISELLDFTRARLGGGISIEPRPVDLADVCAEVISELEAGHPDRSVAFDADANTHGIWDRERLAQVVSNLIGNAIQHGKPDGALQVHLRGEGDSVRLEVHNEGAAIPAELVPSIFDPFRRQPRAGQKSEGLGLGLYICRELVRAHGGEIAVQSTDEAGTTFTVRLPRKRPPPHELR